MTQTVQLSSDQSKEQSAADCACYHTQPCACPIGNLVLATEIISSLHLLPPAHNPTFGIKDDAGCAPGHEAGGGEQGAGHALGDRLGRRTRTALA